MINSLRLLVIILMTVFSAFFGSVILLFTFNRNIAIKISSFVWSHVVLAASGVRLRIHNRTLANTQGAGIYIANHASHLDIPAVFLASPVPLYFIAKKELAKIPIMGWYMHLTGMIFIDRGDRERAYKSIHKAGELIKSGRNVISFPEGTRSKSGKMANFKRGSFILAKDAKIPIYPLAIKGSYERLAPGKFKIYPGKIEVIFGEAILPETYQNMSVEELALFCENKVKTLYSSN
jgi:1-acyl-sn-glycerol-3-phosphate acyltransferase